MKGIKMTLDTKVQPNLVSDWRNIGGYDKSVDAIVVNVGEGSVNDVNVYISNPVADDVYTVSFDAWGSTENNKIKIHQYGTEDVLACATGGVIWSWDNGHVEWSNLSEKSKRYFVTYKLKDDSTGHIIIRIFPGTTYIRNIKLEKSPYPTDYEE